jgi:hypothetical protein
LTGNFALGLNGELFEEFRRDVASTVDNSDDIHAVLFGTVKDQIIADGDAPERGQ